jgi:hypothetical protein
MKRTSAVAAVLAAISMVSAQGAAYADTPSEQEYTIVVPVNIANVHPSITYLDVNCSLGSYEASAGGYAIKHGDSTNQRLTLTNGGYSGDVTVRIVDNPRLAPRVDQWRCSLSCALGSLGVVSSPNHPSFKEEYRRAPGSEYRDEVSGRISQ